jgi:uncharacterized protein (TIGR03435 family)
MLAATSLPVFAQSAPSAAVPAVASAPEFEVATIKPVATPDPNRAYDRTEGRRFLAHHMTLRDLIMMANHVDAREIAGGPAWVASDEYDVEAVAGENSQWPDQREAMLKKLLADRFQLAFHREQRTLPVYELVIAKGGSKLKAADTGAHSGASCEHFGSCNFHNEPLAHFSRWLAYAVLDRPVIDKTGLAETYDFTLRWTPDESQFTTSGLRAPQAAGDAVTPPLFVAIEEQLGLKLVPEKMPAEVLVIDRAERPSEN